MTFNKKQWSKKYYLRNREILLAKSKKWNKENKDKMKVIRRKWRIKNQKKNRELAKSWGLRNREYVFYNAKIQDFKRRKAIGKFSLKEWNTLKKKFNYRCAICKKRKKLTIDHIIPLNKGGTNFIDNIQPLCNQCNCSKGDKLMPVETKRGNTQKGDAIVRTATITKRNRRSKQK
jgi:5-methylcytosine-specific restriction endonuclease McrA